jgi:hypothetical protein
MALTKIPARDFTIEIDANYGESGGENFIPIGGIESLTPSPSTNRADTTDYDSQGVAEHMVMERGLAFTISGRHLEDAATGERDAGQAAVEALARRVGLNSNGSFKVTSPGGNVDSFLASAEVTTAGGGHNDPATWGAALTINGAVSHA